MPWSRGRVMRCRCRLRRAGWARVAVARRRSCGGLATDGLRVVDLGLVLARVPWMRKGNPLGPSTPHPPGGEGAKSGLGPDLALYVALRTSGGLPHPCLRVVHLGLVLLREGASGGGDAHRTRGGPGVPGVCVGGGGPRRAQRKSCRPSLGAASAGYQRVLAVWAQLAPQGAAPVGAPGPRRASGPSRWAWGCGRRGQPRLTREGGGQGGSGSPSRRSKWGWSGYS